MSLTFAAAEMVGYAIAYGREDLLLPVRQLTAIVVGEEALDRDFSVLTVLLVGGVVVNVALNVTFCALFAAIVAAVPQTAATDRRLVSAAIVFGVLLWLVNFYLLTPLVGWDWFPDLHHPVVVGIAHAVFFGLPLGAWLALRGARPFDRREKAS